jgi:hypothetical protein
MELVKAGAAVGLGMVAVLVALHALAHAVEGYHLARDGLTARRGAVTGMVWTLTLVALGGVALVMGGWFWLLWRLWQVGPQ